MEFEHLSGMEELKYEFNNTYNLAAGLEALIAAGPAASYEGFEAQYAHTVLTIDGADMSGQEGFLDSIKRGAAKVYEWIRDLIRSIRNWFTGGTKAKYEQAKKELTGADIELVKRVQALKEKGIDAYIKYDPDESTYTIIKRLNPEQKAKVNEEIKNVDIPGVSSPADLKEKIEGTVVNEIAAKIAVRLSQMNTQVKEIRRIDPDQSTMERLGLDSWAFITDGSRGLDDKFLWDNQISFARRVERVVRNADDAQKDLANAVVRLEKLNNEAKGHEDKERQVARAAKIVGILTDLAAKWRDLVMTINYLVNKAVKDVADGIVKKALQSAVEDTHDATGKYAAMI